MVVAVAPENPGAVVVFGGKVVIVGTCAMHATETNNKKINTRFFIGIICKIEKLY